VIRLRSAAPLAVSILVLVGCTGRAPQTSATAPAAGPVERAAVLRVNPASANDGGRIYLKNCSSCHQADGQGVVGAFPPLAGNPEVTGNPLRTIAVVKFGFSGKTRVEGREYNGTMPAWGQLISDDDIAAVVSYIRAAWHNDAKPVSLADVQTASK
jgi:mono/diheme cytochrome c family protein